MRLAITSTAVVAIALVAIFAMPWDGGPLAWMPSEGEVSKHFEERHSGLSVIGVSAGAGDNDQRTYVIAYAPRSGGATKQAEWSVHSSGCLYGWKIDHENLSVPQQQN